MAGELAKVDRIGRAAAPGVLSALLALTSDAVLTLDGLFRVISANPQAEVLCGLSAEELRNTPIQDLLFDATRDAANASEREAAMMPVPADGSLVELSLRLGQGGAAAVVVRADRVSAPGETYLLLMRPADRSLADEREHDRLLDELALANRRLSGTLKIVLGTIDAQDVESLFSEVLEQMSDTLEASGALLFLAQGAGYRLRATTRSLAGRSVPQFMAYGEGLETIVTRAGHALRLRLAQPSGQSLRAGTLSSRELIDEEDGERHRILARQVPPFVSLICVPVWYGGHVIAIIELGWAEARPIRREDARLLDSVSQYLSIEFAAAISTMRADRAQRLDAAALRLRDVLGSNREEGPQAFEERLRHAANELCQELGVQLAEISCDAHGAGCAVFLPEAGELELPCSMDELVAGHVDAGIAVLPASKAGKLGDWLADAGLSPAVVLLDLGELAGRRRSALLLRPAAQEPQDETELDFLRRVANDIRQAAEAGQRRQEDTRIAQALQSGMRSELQQVEGITAHALYSSATAAALVGGDFYDLIRLPGRRACVILGDVSGKGVEAASVSAAVRTALGAYAWEGQPPARMVRLLNDFLLGFSRLETFATLFVGVIDLAHAALTYCSAGHPPALLLRACPHEMLTLDEQSGVVGAFKGMTYHDGHMGLAEGDRLVLYTDGVTEARSPSGSFFGEQGLRDAVMEEAQGSFEGMLERLLARLDAFTERRLEDDVAMVALRFDRLGKR